jgi:hypothetical protein
MLIVHIIVSQVVLFNLVEKIKFCSISNPSTPHHTTAHHTTAAAQHSTAQHAQLN